MKPKNHTPLLPRTRQTAFKVEIETSLPKRDEAKIAV
jgi:hypothetical protein